ncbi:hypothetical protein B0I08_11225 [Glaciihabitans tibetensis]|uniref:Uncharacterized protein n=1 Tax=Glaciihabitans tibetensis TaxID=1266600 RepID=A0A2T0V399_9MICO|nr:hypothetical protein B0I08_11225 [Glaciihabitans tibetensis]
MGWVLVNVATLFTLKVVESTPETPITPAPRRVYREAEKAQFLEAFERLGKVSLVKPRVLWRLGYARSSALVL